MRFEKGHKEATRRRIIEVASERFRKDGVAAVGIATIMADAGLTHGGFYAHFESKEDLVHEAIVAALSSTKSLRETAGLERLIRSYLRPSHRDTPEKGCAIAPLVSEIARHGASTREIFTKQLESDLELTASQLPAGTPPEAHKAIAIGIFGVMLGTLQLSRAVNDKELSDLILESGIQAALKLARTE